MQSLITIIYIFIARVESVRGVLKDLKILICISVMLSFLAYHLLSLITAIVAVQRNFAMLFLVFILFKVLFVFIEMVNSRV